jgi:hypothetical protein
MFALDPTPYQIKKKNDLTTLKYVQPASPMSQEEGGLVTTTVRDYDLQETSKAMKGLFTVSGTSSGYQSKLDLLG